MDVQQMLVVSHGYICGPSGRSILFDDLAMVADCNLKFVQVSTAPPLGLLYLLLHDFILYV